MDVSQSSGCSKIWTVFIAVSSGDFTTVEMNAIARTLNNSCFQSLARARGIHKNVEVCFPNNSGQVEFFGIKPQFAEIFRYYITVAQMFQNRGFRSIPKITAHSLEDETRSSERNANRNPAWWGDLVN